MIDGHIHLEQGPYTLEWVNQFVKRAVETGLEEIRLLEHCYRFAEFVPMYASVCEHSDYVKDWFHRRAGVSSLEAYLELIRRVRQEQFPVRIRFGLEICYFPDQEALVAELTKGLGLDFLLGSIHFVDGLAYDLDPSLWDGVDVDRVYGRYFEDSVSLAKSGLFDGIGHPDAIKLFGHRPSYPLTDAYEQVAKALAEGGMYADQNSGAARRHPETASFGIDQEYLGILKKHGVKLITSSDAHCPRDVGYKIQQLEACIQEAAASGR